MIRPPFRLAADKDSTDSRTRSRDSVVAQAMEIVDVAERDR